MKKTIAALLLAALLLSLAACGDKGPQRYEANYWDLFDTATSITGYAESEADFTRQARFVHDELLDYHRLYDIYNDYESVNNLKTVNDSAGRAPVQVDQKIIDLLLACKELYGVTQGRVNVAMGSVLSLWHDYREAGTAHPEQAALPPMGELEEAARHTAIGDLVIDERASTVYLADPDMRLDVGAVAKGYAAQRVAEACRAQGYGSLLISVGGNVCAIGGQDSAGKPWTVAVTDPSGERPYLHALAVADATLVTSGSYQRQYTVDGKSYHHIIDPDTLMPAAYFTSVTVLAEDSGCADALSTALFILPYGEGAALAASLDGVEALWVETDGTQHMTDGFRAALVDEALKK